jgi:hypothetical protein
VPGSRRGNAAQRPAIFRLVGWSKGWIIPLDYNTPAIDEKVEICRPLLKAQKDHP